MKTVLVDTSFLITLANPTQRKHHKIAVQYFRASVDRGVVLHLSTIVIAEFFSEAADSGPRPAQLRRAAVQYRPCDRCRAAERLVG
jgi:predicted nucleic acid-binding protein